VRKATGGPMKKPPAEAGGLKLLVCE
jgi:hypothetical protein